MLEASQQLHTRPQERGVPTVSDSGDRCLPAAASSFVVQVPDEDEGSLVAAPLFADSDQDLTARVSAERAVPTGGDTLAPHSASDTLALASDTLALLSACGSLALASSPMAVGGTQVSPAYSSAPGGDQESPASSSTTGVRQPTPALSLLEGGGGPAPDVVPTPAPLTADPIKTTKGRRSVRNKDKADEHTLHKTSQVAAKKNLEPGTSFTSFSDSHVISNLGRVGFKLGQTDELVKASSIKIKNLEIDRMVVLANQKNMQLKIE